MPSEVGTAFRRRDANLFKSRHSRRTWGSNRDVRRAMDRLSVVGGVRAQEQSQGFSIKAIVEVMEKLVEIISSEEHLIGQLRRKRRVEYGGAVIHVQRRHFEVVLQVRARRSQRRAATCRCGLTTLSTKPTNENAVLVADVVIDLCDPVVAVARRG